MKKVSYITILLLSFIVACSTTQKQNTKGSRSLIVVGPDDVHANWDRTPEDVLKNPVEDEPLIWVGLVKNVFVRKQNDKIEIEWLCEHLAFSEPGPASISVWPIRTHKGRGYFALSEILNDMSMEQAMKFKKEFTDSPYYILVEGIFAGFKEIGGMKVPFLNVYGVGMGPDLAKIIQ